MANKVKDNFFWIIPLALIAFYFVYYTFLEGHFVAHKKVPKQQVAVVEAEIEPASEEIIITAEESSKEENEIRVKISARDSAKLSSEMSGQIENIYFNDGDIVKKGQTIIKFDCSEQKAQTNNAQSKASKYRKIADSKSRLLELGSGSKVELDVAKAELSMAYSEVNMAKTILDHCNIKSPLDGRIGDLLVKQHQFVKEGVYLLEIVGDKELEIDFFAPSKWLLWLDKGHKFQVKVDETAQIYDAEITRIGGKVDPVSQTIRLYGKLIGETPKLRSGMSGYAIINQEADAINETESK